MADKQFPSRGNMHSFYLKPEVIEPMDVLRQKWGVGKSQLATWLLLYALKAVKEGKLEPTWERKRRAKLE